MLLILDVHHEVVWRRMVAVVGLQFPPDNFSYSVHPLNAAIEK